MGSQVAAQTPRERCEDSVGRGAALPEPGADLRSRNLLHLAVGLAPSERSLGGALQEPAAAPAIECLGPDAYPGPCPADAGPSPEARECASAGREAAPTASAVQRLRAEDVAALEGMGFTSRQTEAALQRWASTGRNAGAPCMEALLDLLVQVEDGPGAPAEAGPSCSGSDAAQAIPAGSPQKPCTAHVSLSCSTSEGSHEVVSVDSEEPMDRACAVVVVDAGDVPEPAARASNDQQTLGQLWELTRTFSSQSLQVADEAQIAGVPFPTVVQLLADSSASERDGRMTVRERAQLKSHLREGGQGAARKLLEEATRRQEAVREPPCPVCLCDLEPGEGCALRCGHVLCRSCAEGVVTHEATPACPEPSCRARLTADEVLLIGGEERHGAFQALLLQQAIETMSDRLECPNPDCGHVLVCDPGHREPVVCHCGWPAFCSCCRQPYHVHKQCGEVAPLREEWAQWVLDGRQRYHGRVQAAQATLKQGQAVQEALARQRELEADEKYKEQHCRACPHCGRCVEKLEGCDSMKCGSDAHGNTNLQNGCRKTFNWNAAQPYKARVDRRPVPKVDLEKAKVDGKDVRHFLVTCDGCGARNFQGPRFRCAHCSDYNLCVNCDSQAKDHPADHVFEILFCAEQAYNEDLPSGAKVDFLGLTQHFFLNGQTAHVRRFLPSSNCYEVSIPASVPRFDVSLPRGDPEAGLKFLDSPVQEGAPRASTSSPAPLPFADDEPLCSTPRAQATGWRAQQHVQGGRRLLVPQRFVQLAGDTSDQDLMEILEAMEVQRAARSRSWITLPEGQRVCVSGIAQTNKATQQDVQEGVLATVGKFFSGMAQTDKETPQDFHESVLATIANPHSVGGQFLYAMEDNKQWRTDASCVYPVVERRVDLRALEELDGAQRQVARCTFDLPVGQLVEAGGRLMVTAAACDGQSYKVRPWSASGRERMAADYSVADLLHLSHGQLVDLWERFGLPTSQHRGPDAYVEEAMEFLPAEKTETLLEVSCLKLRPLITEAAELLQLRERRAAAERLGVAPVKGQLQKCAKCGELIRGYTATCNEQPEALYHFGCLPCQE